MSTIFFSISRVQETYTELTPLISYRSTISLPLCLGGNIIRENLMHSEAILKHVAPQKTIDEMGLFKKNETFILFLMIKETDLSLLLPFVKSDLKTSLAAFY